MANRFDVVPVGTDDESSIVVCVVVRAQPRRSVVLSAASRAARKNTANLLACPGRECPNGDVQAFQCFGRDTMKPSARGTELDSIWGPFRGVSYYASGSSALRKNALLAS